MNFDRFSPQSFERFAQALVMQVFGAGVVIFGPGPDGGREATFEGRIPFPSKTDCWEGYTVVQAKYKETVGEPADNLLWLKAQATAEMSKFLSLRRNLKKPNNYLLITNVNLSSVAKVGGKDQMESFFEVYRSEIPGFKYALWTKDELKSLLDNSENIRRAFCAWLTPSDVLAALIDSLARPNLSRVAPLALARDLRQERDVRLRDAGQETETPIFLEDVFIDLPFESDSTNIYISDPDIQNLPLPQPAIRTKALAALLSLSQEKHDGITSSSSLDFAPSGLRNRIVILGGPGQGKSTLGQFLAQIFRVTLLSATDRGRITLPTLDIALHIKAKIRDYGITDAVPARFPFRIDLPVFADALRKTADDETSISLLAFIKERFQRNTDIDITADDLRHWIGACPNVMILDGLDEVPPSANRQAVIKAIEALWDDLSIVQADTLMIVTSRPQGYSNDLNSKYWQHWELDSLDADEALEYASKLSAIRLSDEDRRNQVQDALQNAVADIATRQLMTSPLQVAIMFGIALLKGAIPSDRWDLFNRYYELLRDRESQKPGPLATIFRDYKRQIDLIHYTVGFYLQALSEVPGNANIYLTDSQFKQVVEQALRDDGYEPDDIANVTGDIMRLATQRLVLLAQRTEHQIAFDVRSLQEFMASAQITILSRTASTSARLRSIAGSAHWRHAFRISASKIFSVAGFEQYRDDVLSILHSLDSGDLGEGGRLGRLGARLAASIVLDGVTNSSPRFLKLFTRRALQALDLNPAHFREATLLSAMYKHSLHSIYAEEIASRLALGYNQETIGAWSLTLDLMNSAPSFPKELAIRFWPRNPTECFDLIVGQQIDDLPDEIVQIVRDCQRQAGFIPTFSFLTRWSLSPVWNFRSPKQAAMFDRMALLDFGFLRNYQNHALLELAIIKVDQETILSTKIVSLRDTYPIKLSIDILEEDGWALPKRMLSFFQKPSEQSLKEVISSIDDATLHILLRGPQMNWVFQSVIAELNYSKPMNGLREFSAWSMGDYETWIAAEERWKAFSFVDEDYLSWNRPHYLHPDIDRVGAPYFWALSRNGNRDCKLAEFARAIKVAEGIVEPLKRERLSNGIMFAFNNDPVKRSLHMMEKLYKFGLETAIPRGHIMESINIALKGNSQCWRSKEFCSRVHSAVHMIKNGFRPEVHWPYVVEAFRVDTSMRGLIPFVVYAVCSQTNRGEINKADLDPSALSIQESDLPIIKSAILILQSISGQIAIQGIDQHAKAILDEIWSFEDNEIKELITLVLIRDRDTGYRLLETLWSIATAEGHRARSVLSSLISRASEGRETGLLSAEIVSDLDLPLIPPSFRVDRSKQHDGTAEREH